ncbi:MAG: transposase [Candidatus Aminicenantales bacterium]
MKNVFLFKAEDLSPRVRYEKLFENLPPLLDIPQATGRPPICRDAILRALIYKNLRGLPTLTELVFELENNPVMAEVLGFAPGQPAPSKERFSQFLRTISYDDLQTVRLALVRRLIQDGVITGKHLALDSCPIKANVKENNLKTSAPNRFDKTRRLRGDPDARLGIFLQYPLTFQAKVSWFWGYRNHILNDVFSELPLHEKTLPADHDEKKQAVPLLREARELLSLPTECVIGDANFDTEEILSYIFVEMKAMPVIPRNLRYTPPSSFTLKRGIVRCPGLLEMHRKGKMTSGGKTYLQYTCPLHWGKKYQGQYLLCPAGHPKYVKQKGCNYLVRLSPSIRDVIAYGTRRFKLAYNRRTSAERIFSRLLAISMQRPTVIGLAATRNHCTIAHITVLLVALTAHRLGFYDKIRYVKSFLPNLVK